MPGFSHWPLPYMYIHRPLMLQTEVQSRGQGPSLYQREKDSDRQRRREKYIQTDT